jgi:predicted Zn-dependent protease
MKNKLFILSTLVMMLVVACTTNPITGRSQLSLVSEGEVQNMAKSEYQTFLSQNKVVSANSSRDAEMVRRVGSRIASAITQYYAHNLVDNKEANAWCMPGGKIVVYTGLLPMTQNEAALAVVLGHEITHAVAHHGVERMSQGLVQQLGGAALSVALANKPAETQNLFLQAYGVGSSVGVMLPFSRKQEYEADHYGLIFAAMAGYNPREAIALWQRMQAASGSRPPEFLSDHPAEGNRIARLQQYMPEALKYYKPMGSR